MKASRFLTRSVFVGLLFVLFSASVVSAPLEVQDGETSFDGTVVGGESVSFDVNFTNSLEENLSFLAILTLSSNEVGVDGGEIESGSFSGKLNGVSVGCVAHQDVSASEKTFLCSTGDLNVASPGLNEFNLSFRTVPYIQPATYSMSLDVKSVIGNSSSVFSAPAIRVQEGVSNSVNVSDNLNIKVNSSRDANLIAMNYSEVLVDPPEADASYIDGVMVNLYSGEYTESTYEDVSGSGSVNVSYSESLDEDGSRVGIFYYNDTQRAWENVTDERNRDSNYVYSEVSHFSTYAAYSIPESDEQDQDNESGDEQGDEDGGSSPGFGGSFPSNPDNETGEGNETEENNSEQTPDENQGNETEDSEGSEDQNEENETEGTETGQEDDEENDTGSGGYWFGDGGLFTGLASGGPGNAPIGILALFIGLIAVLQYTGRVDLKALASRFSR